jgi:hypothetical protein
MSCDHQLVSDHLMDYLDGLLPAGMASRCEQAIRHCAHCRELHTQASTFARLASGWRDQSVPDWHRARFATRPPRRQADWFNWGALGTSMAALLLVILQVQISISDGLHITFGGRATELLVEQVIDDRLAAQQQWQDLLLAIRLEEYTERQQTLTQLALAQWIESNRSERRQELSLLLSTWESQRYQDQEFFEDELNRLAASQVEYDIYLNALMRNISFPTGAGL